MTTGLNITFQFYNLTFIGPLHWTLLARARSVDNQIYTAMCSPARDIAADYHAYGHSMIVDPNGELLCEAEDSEVIVYADILPDTMQKGEFVFMLVLFN